MPHTLSPPTAGQSLAEFDPEMAELVKEERDRQVENVQFQWRKMVKRFQKTQKPSFFLRSSV